MELRLVSPAPPARPTPQWLLSNGELTVGPVSTELLVRGVTQGRVPSDVWVRELRSHRWRALYQIREVAALERPRPRRAPPLEALGLGELPLSQALRFARDASEMLHFGLHAALATTRSVIGLVHGFERPWGPPVTSVAYGPGTQGLLGLSVPLRDVALGAARARCLVLGPPETSSIHHAAALRLGGGARCFASVAVVPIWRDGELHAVFELGRVDHPFRDADGDALRHLALELGHHLARGTN